MTESVTESTSEPEIHVLSDSWIESEGQSEIQLRCESENHLQNESGNDSRIDSWNDSPSESIRNGSISVRRAA